MPESHLENLYYVEMYKHYCSSRPGPGRIPVTLQGLWTTDGAWPPWRGSYTTDMNTQQSYWPVYTSNHLESAEPLYEMYWRTLPMHRQLGTYFTVRKSRSSPVSTAPAASRSRVFSRTNIRPAPVRGRRTISGCTGGIRGIAGSYANVRIRS